MNKLFCESTYSPSPKTMISDSSHSSFPESDGDMVIVENEENTEEQIDSDIEAGVTEDPLLMDDIFTIHLESELTPAQLGILAQKNSFQTNANISWTALSKLVVVKPQIEPQNQKVISASILEGDVSRPAAPRDPIAVDEEFFFEKCFIKSQISKHVEASNKRFNDKPLTNKQKELLAIMSSYMDFFYPEETLDTLEEIRLVYCLHAVNHALKTRLKIVYNNRKTEKTEIRDQGIVRPKVLMLLPFRDSALRAVKMIASLLGTDNIINKKRFYGEFGGQTLIMPYKNPKPLDYQRTFTGNTHDNFRIGLGITKKSVKLYTDFYNSDIIISSPLALRMLIGGDGEKKDYDFLSSIEVLILDQTEIFTVQNWEHVLHVMNHLHLVPKESHGTDLLRVRLWCLNGWSKYYMQTIIFCSHQMPEINSLSKSRFNYAGQVLVNNHILNGSISKVYTQMPQLFHRVQASSLIDAHEKRFEEFTSKSIPHFKSSNTKNVLIFVPSYFDFIKIRNYFKKQDISFVQICEYTKDEKVARARDLFFHGEVCFMLYTERTHFFKRLKIKGAKHIFFYQPPSFPSFYSEVINFMQTVQKKDANAGSDILSVTVLFTKYDITQLANIVGSERAAQMIASDQSVHMYMTGS